MEFETSRSKEVIEAGAARNERCAIAMAGAISMLLSIAIRSRGDKEIVYYARLVEKLLHKVIDEKFTEEEINQINAQLIAFDRDLTDIRKGR